MHPINLLSFSNTSQLPVILQTEEAECALACLAMVASFHGRRSDLSTLRREHPISIKGTSLDALMRTADALQFTTRALRFELEVINKLEMPAILHWDLNHFVVLKAVKRNKIIIHDPARGERVLSFEEASPHITGVALELKPTKAFEKKDEVRKVRLSDFWDRIIGLKRNIVQVVILSGLLQLFALLSPLYTQLVVDEAITKNDENFLIVLAIGFGLLAIISAVTTTLRSYVMLYFTRMLSFQMAVNLFRHLVRLPVEFFEKRHIGDIVSRFGSLKPIEALFTSGLAAVVVDGAMAITTLVLMLVYSWQLSLAVIVSIIVHLLLYWAMFPLIRKKTEENIHMAAKEQSVFLETIRAVRTIKVFGREQNRENIWQNSRADVINSEALLQKININFRFAQSLLSGLTTILVLYLGAQQVMEGAFTIGMLFAFQAYKDQFSTRIKALIDQFFAFRMLGLHLKRLADIVHTETEKGIDGAQKSHKALTGKIILKNISFRYAAQEPLVLERISCDVKAGENIAIIGPTGGGKSTLLKVMIGLLPPAQGDILLDGEPLSTIGVKNFRRQIGVVMQDDRLLSGTIADNISFFDPNADQTKVQACAQAAILHNEIMAMPMNYNTLIGDMGTALSGGQKQRLLIARALYHKPKILFLDEGTANLDLETEKQIVAVLKSLPITKILIAHRSEMIDSADRVFELKGKHLTELPKPRD